MRAQPYRIPPRAARYVAWLTVGVLTTALSVAPPRELSTHRPTGTPTREAMATWARIDGDVETTAVRVVYELYVRPERSGLYTVTHYRVTRKDDQADRGARDESEKYIWNEAHGRPLRCFAREADGAWRALEHGSNEYQAEMLTAMAVYALHRQVTLSR